MAVVSVNEITEGREAEKSVDGRRYTRSWMVILDDPADAELESRLAVEDFDQSVRIGLPHPKDSYAILRSIVPTQHEGSRLVWRVIGRYDRGEVGYQDQQVDEPQIRHAEVEFTQAAYEVARTEDLSDPPVKILNSARQAFDPTLTITEYRPVFVVRQYEIRTIADQALFVWTYHNTVNSAKFLGADIGQLRVKINSRRVVEADAFFWYTTYELELHPTKWSDEGKVRDEGYHELFWEHPEGQPGRWSLRRIGVAGSTAPSEDGEPVAEPWPLNGAGKALTAEEASNPDNHSYRQFKVYREKDFDNLQLRLVD